MTWFVYIVRCSDASLYTGIATDVARRVGEHNGSKLGARYTSSRQPVVLLYAVECGTRSDALREELRIKKLPRAQKLRLIEDAEQGAHATREKQEGCLRGKKQPSTTLEGTSRSELRI